jgi:ribosomal protein S18 acetylase RimI-like enzyme
MSFFRRKVSSEALVARLATADDHARLLRLAHTAERRFLTSAIGDLSRLLAADPTAMLEVEGRLVGLLHFGWRTPPVAWLRTVALQNDLAVAEALKALSVPIYGVLRREGVRLVATTLDEWNEPWLRRPLERLGYRPMVEVVGYEKNRFDRPSAGNQVVVIRRAVPADLQAVLALDAACFPLPWVKGAEILEPAIADSPDFILAEFAGQPVGYAFVTGHQGGRLFHLVRIAVAPAYQGRAIGVRLLAEIVDGCAARRADVLTLNTQADNYGAQRLYEWFGFKRTGEQQTVLGTDLPDV